MADPPDYTDMATACERCGKAPNPKGTRTYVKIGASAGWWICYPCVPLVRAFMSPGLDPAEAAPFELTAKRADAGRIAVAALKHGIDNPPLRIGVHVRCGSDGTTRVKGHGVASVTIEGITYPIKPGATLVVGPAPEDDNA